MSSESVRLKIKQRRKSIVNREMLIAASEGQLNEVKLSIRAGADVNFTDNDGNTALHYAVANDKVEVVQHLLRLPVDITCENCENVTPLDLARERNIQPILESIEDRVWINTLQTLKQDYPLQNESNRGASSDEQQKTSFTDATLSGIYWKSMQMEDIANILRFRYLKDNSCEMFATNNLEDIRSTLERCKSTRKKCILILGVGKSRWTTIAVHFRTNIKRFHAYVENPSFIDAANVIADILIEVLQADVEFYEFPFYEKIHQNCGIFALTYADKFNSCMEDNEKLQEALDLKTMDEIGERIFLANLLNEKLRTEQKIKTCSEILKKLVANKKDISKLTFKNMIAFVLFLEAFALEDTHITVDDPKLEKTVRKIKKDYFTYYYFQPKGNDGNEKPDYRLIVDARSSLLHGSRIVTLHDCKKFIGKDKLVKNFFKEMNSFVNGIQTKITSNDHGYDIIKCSSFLSQIVKDIGVEGDMEQFGKFMKILYQSENDITDEKLEEIMFELTVNVIPLLDNQKEKFGPLRHIRNKLIHNFQQYSTSERLREMKRLTFPLKSNLFKYYYAKRVHDILVKDSLYDSCESLDKKIVDVLKVFEEDFKKKTNVASADDANSFEYSFQNSIFPQKDEEIDTLIEQYFEYMIIIDGSAVFDQVLNDEADSSEFSNEGWQLNDLQKREIFEDILKIKSFLKTNKDFSHNLLAELNIKMKQYGVTEPIIDKIIENVTTNKYSIDQQTKNHLIQIRDNLLIMKNFMTKHNIPLQVMITSYKCNKFALIHETAQESKQLVNTYMFGKFLSLLKANFSVKIHNMEVNVNLETITINILKLFHSTYNKYQIKFNNAEDAFRDEIFLGYLVSRLRPENKSDELYAALVMKKLLKIKYTLPYIAHLMEKFPSVDMEKKDIREMVVCFCRNDAIVSHLGILIKAMENGCKYNIFEEIVTLVINKEDVCNEVLEITLQDESHIEKFLKEISKQLIERQSDVIINIVRRVLIALNGKIRQLLYKSKYSEADQIVELEVMNIIYSQAIELELEEINDYCLYAAKVKNFCGSEEKKKNNREGAENLYHEALTFLDKVTNPSIRQKFLVLSRRSFTKQLLGQFADALCGFEKMYKEIVMFSLSLNELPERGMYDASVFTLVEKSSHYNELLESSHDDQKYLNIFSIRCSMAFILEQQMKYQEAIFIYRELYKVQQDLGKDKLVTFSLLKNIAKQNKLLGDVYLKDMKYLEARKCYNDSLVVSSKLLSINKVIRGSIHPMNLEISKFTCRVVGSVRYSYLKQAKIETDKNKIKNLYDKADVIVNECTLNSLYEIDRWKDVINRKIPQYEGEKRANVNF